MSGNYLVTGATSGLGEYISRALAACGHHVILLGRKEEKLNKLCCEIGENAQGITVDLEDTEKIAEVFKNCPVKLNGMIHCAGLNESSLLKMSERETAQKVMNVNSLSFVELGKHFCKKKHSCEGASIVVVSSMAAKNCPAGMGLYSASKAALNSLVMTMARENTKRKIRVNAVMPGYLEKAMQNEVLLWQLKSSGDDMLKEIQPFGLIPYEQVWMMIDFLLSEHSRYVTGSIIEISGGQ